MFPMQHTVRRHFLDESRRNKINFTVLNDIWLNTNSEVIRYAFFDDSITINNKVYSKLYIIHDTLLNSSTAQYVFPFREDSNKKVYFIHDTLEIMLYDFSVNVGDTIYYDYTFEGTALEPLSHYKILDSTSTVLINNQIRKKYYFSGDITGNIWIEGIGAIDGEGLMAPISSICTCGQILYLSCVKQADTVLWMNNPICNKCFCYNYNGINDLNKNQDITIYPNPTESSFTINLRNLNSYSIAKLYSYDMKLIEQFNVGTDKELKINKELKKGIYFIKVEYNDKYLLKKLVIN